MALTANKSFELMVKQARLFTPELVFLADEHKNAILKAELAGSGIVVAEGDDALIQAATLPSADIVLMALVGFSGFEPTLKALETGKMVALANKESLIVGGELISAKIPGYRKQIIPVDSEHSALFQCLQGEAEKSVRKIILTASGGPFRGMNPEELATVTAREALKHPNWDMGAKITVDSATMMNKGFEVLEAQWLFDMPLDKIEVLVHPQSIVHSLVEFSDGSVIAQLSLPDMRLPIQYALTFPERLNSLCPRVNLVSQPLQFEEPDGDAFPCLGYAFEAGRIGGTMPACLNAANEVAVELFLEDKIGFYGISRIIRTVMDNHRTIPDPDMAQIIEADRFSRTMAFKLAQELG